MVALSSVVNLSDPRNNFDRTYHAKGLTQIFTCAICITKHMSCDRFVGNYKLQSKWKFCAVGFMQISLEWVVISTWGLQGTVQVLCPVFKTAYAPSSQAVKLGHKKPRLKVCWCVVKNRKMDRIEKFSLSVKWYADMLSSYWNISTKPTAQSFHFDCSWQKHAILDGSSAALFNQCRPIDVLKTGLLFR